MINNIVVALVIGYLLRSFPSAYLAGRLRKSYLLRLPRRLLVFYSIGIGVFMRPHYIPRFNDMRSKPTYDWRRIVKGYSLKERYQYVSQ
jgi:hypothetical protein